MVKGRTDAYDVSKRIKTWWSFFIRPIMGFLFPCWVCSPSLFVDTGPQNRTVTGTIVCPQKDKVRLCIQQDSRSFPNLLLDLPFNTCDLATEIHRGMSRIALECGRDARGPLLDAPSWAVYCNGRKVGFATKRHVTEKDTWLLETIRTVSAGAGIVAGKTPGSGGFTYLRGAFERVVGSEDSESYHLIDPSRCMVQHDFSIFFLRL